MTVEDRQRRTFQADILFQDDPLPANDKAILGTDALDGVFWQKDGLLLDKNPAKAKTLKRSAGGGEIPIQNLKECRSALGIHYHFDVVKSK
jgi:hypothetical protein